jgi:hypothetical protein
LGAAFWGRRSLGERKVKDGGKERLGAASEGGRPKVLALPGVPLLPLGCRLQLWGTGP